MQTKETLTLKAASFGSKCELTPKFMDNVGKIGVMDAILAFANFKQNNALKKTDGAKRSRLTGVHIALCFNLSLPMLSRCAATRAQAIMMGINGRLRRCFTPLCNGIWAPCRHSKAG